MESRMYWLVPLGLLVVLLGGCGASPYGSPPTKKDIHQELSLLVETEDPTTHFARNGSPLTISDGNGGTLTAIVGLRNISADGHGEVVFFWHGQTFLGHDRASESMGGDVLSSPSAGVFTVEYPRYRPKDAACCPSLTPAKVNYRWDGKRLKPDKTPPAREIGAGISVYQEKIGQPTITPLPTATPLPSDTPTPAEVMSSSWCVLEGTQYSTYGSETIHLWFQGADASTQCMEARDKWNAHNQLAPLRTMPNGWTSTTADRQVCSYSIHEIVVSVFTDTRYGATQAAVACNWLERISATK